MVELVWRQGWDQGNAPELLDLFFQWRSIPSRANHLLRGHGERPGKGKRKGTRQVHISVAVCDRHAPGKISGGNVAVAARRRDVGGPRERKWSGVGSRRAFYSFHSQLA